LVYLGGVQYSLYVPIFGRLFPGAAAYAAKPLGQKIADVAGSRSMMAQVVLDQFVHHPLAYFPAFYSLKEVVNGGSISDGLAKYSKNYQEDLVALWKLWVPSTIINFTFMPMHMRIPWVATTSLLWTCILSYMRGGDDVMPLDPDEAMNIGGSQGRALKETYDLGVSAKPEYSYDKTKEHQLVTINGRDRIGFIQEVTQQVAENAGNVLDVKAYKVGREGVLIMLLESDPSTAKAMRKSITSLSQKGSAPVQVSVQSTQPWLSDTDSPRCKDGIAFTAHLKATGPDRPGLLRDLTRFLSDQNLDIMSFSCNQHLVRQPGHEETQNVFQMSGVVRSFEAVDRSALADALHDFNANHNCRTQIVEVEDDPSYSSFRSTTQR